MILKYNKLISSLEELKRIDRTNPFNVVGAFISVLDLYDESSEDNVINLLQYLVGDFQIISPMMKQNIKDRMFQNDKYKYIAKSYFKGATPDNNYTPNIPYEIEITKDEISDIEEGFVRLFVKSGGADSKRPVMVRLAKDGNYYVWSDSFIGLLTDIRIPESNNPWA